MAQPTTTYEGKASNQKPNAKDEAQQLAGPAAEKGKEIAETAKAQAGQVGREAAGQARHVVEDAKRQLQDQARTQTDQIAEALRRLERQATALLEGRADEAGALKDYARQMADQLGRLAERTQSRGFDGVIQELQDFGRKRPGAFLAGAAAAGFAVARLMRSGAVTEATRERGAHPDGAGQGTRPAEG